ncbi:MAG: NAD(P)H-dependent glycerol-3-phosphate dehydrogenase [Ghiorsea sp.]|nr:NAD(P)H-dependent glycerol-3-phosphate dehydrogenase [Ghiorsea sp.]
MNEQRVTVWGAGSWGTALAMVLAKHGCEVYLITRNQSTADKLNQDHENARYLKGNIFPKSLHAIGQEHPNLNHILEQSSATVLALPCAVAEVALVRLQTLTHPVIAANKGINPDTLERVDELLIRFVGKSRTLLLSGPSFALEVASGKPTAITLAAANLDLAQHVATLFEDSNFRVYTSTDLVGVALGGALKNVIAIAAGIADGMHLGHNALAALVTRGIAEISRLTEACGGQAETMSGLSGLGDLLLTCTGSLSRNRKMGVALASGLSVEKAREYVGQVVEGEKTAAAAVQLAQKYQVDMPITQMTYAVLQSQISPNQALQTLMERPQRHE